MSSGFLSQEEIDSLLNGGSSDPEPAHDELLSDLEKDLLGEIGNISMGSASTSLSTLIAQPVNITTPVVSVTTLKDLRKTFEVPNIALDVKYVSGITGENLLVMKTTDASVIANLMMGGDGRNYSAELSEIEISAVSEAMNQMIGSAATSMATMFGREVNISPPDSMIWDGTSTNLASNISDDENIVQVSFKLAIGDLVDSNIMQILPIVTAKKIVSIMMGQDDEPISSQASAPVKAPMQQPVQQPVPQAQPQQKPVDNRVNNNRVNTYEQNNYHQNNFSANYNGGYTEPQGYYVPQPEYQHRQQPAVDIHQASFQPLTQSSDSAHGSTKNLDLILDVPLEVSVLLGRAKKNIKDILNLGTGSLIELDKLAEEPVEILVNGKRVAYGEVVVVDENFGVRITSIVSNAERVKSLSGK